MQPGETIAGKYRVERLLGAGGMGSVYVAINEVLQKPVALKVMGDAFATNAVSVQRFFREAMSASRVRHPAIVEIYDAGTHEGAPWMAMELLEGESLGQRLARGPLGLGEVGPVFLPVLSALDAVHAHGIVHRDLKPDNIFLEQLHDGGVQPKVLDFGIAKAADGPSRLTATGTVMGTALYLAPEQARDSSTVDPRSDLYAIGVVLYESISGGRMPHQASTLPELIAKLLTEEPAPILGVAPHVPATLANVVHRCLARDPAARPQSARELAVDLRSALAGIADQPIALAPSRAASPRAVTGSADAFAGTALAAMSPRGPLATQPWSAEAPRVQPFAPVSAKRGGNGLLIAVIGLGAMAVLAVGGALIAAYVAGRGTGETPATGSPAPAYAWPRSWDGMRGPILADADGDGVNDVIGWSWQIVGLLPHYRLCAFEGRTGEELWCSDLGEEGRPTDSRTVLAAGHIVYFDHVGQAAAFALRDGTALAWSATVEGQPQQVCAVGDDGVAVGTADGLWSILTVATGHVALVGPTMPMGCRAVPGAVPSDFSVTVSSMTWTRAPSGSPPGASMQYAEEAFKSPDGTETLAIGSSGPVAASGIGMLALARESEALGWEVQVPIDPLVAQPGVPEAVAITDEVVYVSYALTPRGDAPRHVAAFRMSDGHRLWDIGLREAGVDRVESMVSDGRIVLVVASQVLVALDAENGQRRYRIGEPSSG